MKRGISEGIRVRVELMREIWWSLLATDAAGHVTQASEAGRANTLIDIYDQATGQLIWTEAEHGSNTLVFDEQYTYDIWGERTEREDLVPGQIQSETYTYTAASRLEKAQVTPAGGSKVTTLTANYDAAGNLASKTDRGGSIGYTYAQTGHPNRLTSLSVSGANPGITAGSLRYDAAGRITAGGGYSVQYDRRGLTQEIQAQGDTATLAYAPDGHRYQMTVDGETTVYLAGGSFRVVEQTSGVTAYRQAISAGGMMVAQQVTRSDASSGFEYFYHDGLGSPVA
ncbi:MAG: hypothetical protein ACRD22_13065, partial [Terriglobia bacterium]